MALSVIALKQIDQVIEEGNLRLTYESIFYDPVPLPMGEIQGVNVVFSLASTPTQIENAIEDAIIEVKNQFYPSLTLSRSSIIFLDVKRGA